MGAGYEGNGSGPDSGPGIQGPMATPRGEPPLAVHAGEQATRSHSVSDTPPIVDDCGLQRVLNLFECLVNGIVHQAQRGKR